MYQTLKQASSLQESHISLKKSPLKNGDVLWGRFDQSFFVFGGVLTNSGTFWPGGVLTRGRFDLHPFYPFGKPRMTTRAFVIVRVTDVTETSEF